METLFRLAIVYHELKSLLCRIADTELTNFSAYLRVHTRKMNIIT